MLASEVARETALLAVAAVLSVLPVRVILLGLSRPLPYRLVLFFGKHFYCQNNPTRPAL